MYCTRADLVTRFGESEIDFLEADSPQRLTEVIADASALIDSYLAVRYELPLPSVPPVLMRISRDLVRYAADNAPDEAVTRRRDDAVKLLEAIAKGVGSLGLPKADEPALTENLVEIHGTALHFSRRAGRGAW